MAAPVWTNGYPLIGVVAPTTVEVKTKTNLAGNSYAIAVTHGSAAPTSALVKSGSPAGFVSRVTIPMTAANTEYSGDITGLTSGTIYDIYAVAEDSTPTLQAAPRLLFYGVSLGGLSVIDSTDVARDAFPTLAVRFGGLSAINSSLQGITGITVYSSMAEIFKAAAAQGIITASPYSSSASRVADINSALSLSPSPYDSKPSVVGAWLL